MPPGRLPLVFAANPNLIYMQTTAMGEALYLALFIWVVVYFAEFVRGEAEGSHEVRLVPGCGLPDSLRRMVYGGGNGGDALCVYLLWGRVAQQSSSTSRILRAAVVKFILIAAAAPLLWLAYNGIVYRNPLEFANGPYSAKAIERIAASW